MFFMYNWSAFIQIGEITNNRISIAGCFFTAALLLNLYAMQ